ncbi:MULTISPECIES: hypothetical protein [unclassified Microcoleus]|uniref:hypothetical protein n=1 Tax=unclassified Microcoleus TaxID=2642155 RepID=UPI002FD248CE
MPYALCPMPYALCPMPYALCPMPYASTIALSLSAPRPVKLKSCGCVRLVRSTFLKKT